MYRYETIDDCVGALRNQGYRIIATTPHDDSSVLSDFEIQGRTAFLFGAELEVLIQKALAESDGFLKIPMSGFIESLNISVSAAIIL